MELLLQILQLQSPFRPCLDSFSLSSSLLALVRGILVTNPSRSCSRLERISVKEC